MVSSLEFEQTAPQVSWAEIVEEEEEEVERKLLCRGQAKGSGRNGVSVDSSELRSGESSPVSLDDVAMRRTAPAPRRLNLKHGFMRFIVRNQLDRKNFEEEQTEQKNVRYSQAKDQQEAEHHERAAANNTRDRVRKGRKKDRKNDVNNRGMVAQQEGRKGSRKENKQTNKAAESKKNQSLEQKGEAVQAALPRKRPEIAQRAGFAPYTPPHLRAKNGAPS